MKNYFIVLTACMTLFLWSSLVFAESNQPPFDSVIIYGKTAQKFNSVSLFESGRSKKPHKTAKILSGGKYSISIRIPKDMRKRDSKYLTDMRFWNDANNNGIKDQGEAISQCHFIIWHPEYNKVIMKIYKGPTHEINLSNFKYDWQ